MARLFLKNNISSTLSQTSNVFGSSGSNDSVIIKNTALGTSINSNVEKVQFEGAISDYKFSVQGTQLWVYKGQSLLANIGIQTDSNGTSITFSDTSTTATLTGLNQAKLGQASLTTTAAAISAAQVAGASSILSQVQTKSQSKATYDSSALLAATSTIVQALDASTQQSDWKWNKDVITYSYNTTIPSDYITNNITTTGFKHAATNVQAVTDAYMQSLDQLISSSVVKVSTNGDIRINTVAPSGNENGHAYYPSSYWTYGGDIFLSNTIGTTTETNNDIGVGSYGSSTINHELGHAMGLKHPFAESSDPIGDVNLPTAQDNRVNTIMSYTNYKYLVPVFTSNKASGSVTASYEQTFAQSFMVYDIAVLQSMYGVETASNTGNDTYTFDTTPFYKTIWDAGGVDTLDFSLTTATNNIRLTSGSYSDVNYRSVATQIIDQQNSYYQELGTHYHDNWVAAVYDKYSNDIYTGEKVLGIAYGAVIENAIGGSGADRFYDNAVDNVLWGGAGDDSFYLGAGGFDTIYGETGTDKLVLSLRKANVQLETQVAGETYLLANDFGVKLVGVEQIQFTDQLYYLV